MQLVGVPVDALCGRGCVGVLEFFFYVCFEVGEFSDVLGFVVGLSLICGYVHRPPIGGSASLKVMSGKVLSVTTVLAALSAVSLYSTSVCDFAFPICVLS